MHDEYSSLSDTRSTTNVRDDCFNQVSINVPQSNGFTASCLSRETLGGSIMILLLPEATYTARKPTLIGCSRLPLPARRREEARAMQAP
jgi:hypothetical protein